MNEEHIYFLNNNEEVKEASSIYIGDEANPPKQVTQVYRVNDKGEVILARCYHDYDISYEWSGYDLCTASAVCEYDSTHIVTESVIPSFENDYYLATFENALFEDQRKDYESPYYYINYTNNGIDNLTIDPRPTQAVYNETVQIGLMTSQTTDLLVEVNTIYEDHVFSTTITLSGNQKEHIEFKMPAASVNISLSVAKCTHEGYDYTVGHNNSQHYKICSNCDSLYDYEDHDIQTTITSPGTCIAKSKITKSCSSCDWSVITEGNFNSAKHVSPKEYVLTNHGGSDGKSGTAIMKCDSCYSIIGEEYEKFIHEPDSTGSWNRNDTWGNHWKYCQVSGCYETILEGEHYSEEGWKPNDDEIEGTHVKYCICGYQMDSGYHTDAPYEFIPEDNDCIYHEIKCGLCHQHMGKDFHHDENEDGLCDECSFPIGHQWEDNTFIDSQHHGTVCKRCKTVLPQSEQSHSLTNPEGNKYVCEICNWEYYEN